MFVNSALMAQEAGRAGHRAISALYQVPGLGSSSWKALSWNSGLLKTSFFEPDDDYSIKRTNRKALGKNQIKLAEMVRSRAEARWRNQNLKKGSYSCFRPKGYAGFGMWVQSNSIIFVFHPLSRSSMLLSTLAPAAVFFFWALFCQRRDRSISEHRSSCRPRDKHLYSVSLPDHRDTYHQYAWAANIRVWTEYLLDQGLGNLFHSARYCLDKEPDGAATTNFLATQQDGEDEGEVPSTICSNSLRLPVWAKPRKLLLHGIIDENFQESGLPFASQGVENEIIAQAAGDDSWSPWTTGDQMNQ